MILCGGGLFIKTLVRSRRPITIQQRPVFRPLPKVSYRSSQVVIHRCNFSTDADYLKPITVPWVKQLVKEIYGIVNPKSVHVWTGPNDMAHYEKLLPDNITPETMTREIMKTTRRTLTKTGNEWCIGKKCLSSDEFKKLFSSSMKNKTMFVIPYKFKNTYGVKVTDSLHLVALTAHFNEEDIWSEMKENVEFMVYSEGVTLFQDEVVEGEPIPMSYRPDLLGNFKN